MMNKKQNSEAKNQGGRYLFCFRYSERNRKPSVNRTDYELIWIVIEKKITRKYFPGTKIKRAVEKKNIVATNGQMPIEHFHNSTIWISLIVKRT